MAEFHNLVQNLGFAASGSNFSNESCSGNKSADIYFTTYLKLVNLIRSAGITYMMFLYIFAALSFVINLLVVVALLYFVRMKLYTRHVVFLNLCLTETMAAFWEIYKDDLVLRLNEDEPIKYLWVALVVMLQSASSLTVIMMVAIGVDTYVAIKRPFTYMKVCGTSAKIGIIEVVISWLVIVTFWTLANAFQVWFSLAYCAAAITLVNLITEVISIVVLMFVLVGATVLQVRIYIEVRNMITPQTNLRRSSASMETSTVTQRSRKAFFFSMTTIVIAVAFWLPHSFHRLALTIEIILTRNFNYHQHVIAYQVLHLVYSVQTFVIPAVYAFRIRNPLVVVFEMFRQLHLCIWNRKHRESVSPSRPSTSSRSMKPNRRPKRRGATLRRTTTTASDTDYTTWSSVDSDQPRTSVIRFSDSVLVIPTISAQVEEATSDCLSLASSNGDDVYMYYNQAYCDPCDDPLQISSCSTRHQ